MTGGTSTSAANASVTDVLGYLDGPFAAFAHGVADARYTLWLGSGISLDRVDGLKAVLLRALQKLHDLGDSTDPACPYRAAQHQVLQRSGLAATRLQGLDPNASPDAWDEGDLQDLLTGLATHYAIVLDVRVEGKARDYLLWNVIDVRAAYASGSEEPDCEHVAVAILALEGHVPQIASANWDGLIEGAFEMLGHFDTAHLQVCVHADDLEAPPAKARLLKFHGCAIRAAADEATFRTRLIHQASQISNYRNNADFTAIRNELVSQASTRPTLMIGLSAQDEDIQGVFSDAAAARPWRYPSDPPAYIFAEDSVGADQGTILRNVYGEAFDAQPTQVEASALIRSYAKSLLTGLVLHVLCRKLQHLVGRTHAPALSSSDFRELANDVQVLRDLAAVDLSGDPLDRILRVAAVITRGMHVFRKGVMPAGPLRYWPVTQVPLSVTEADDDVAEGGLPELAVALGLLGQGVANGQWGITPSRSAALDVATKPTSMTTRVLFCATGRASVHLQQSGLVDSADDDVLIIHSDRVVKPTARSPRTAPGRTGRSGPRHVDMVDLLAEAPSLASLRLRFREEAGL